MNKPSRSVLRITFLAVVVLLLVIGANWWAFQYFAHENYFVWYLKNGTLIGMVVSFIALIWEGLSFRTDLLSANPLYYLRGCMALMAAYYLSLSSHLNNNPQSGGRDKDSALVSEFIFPFDGVLSFVVILVMFILGLAWLVIVAPLNYFLTILTGAIARQELGGTCSRTIAVPTKNGYDLVSIPRNKELPDKAINISLAAKPFAITQAITALVLFILKAVLVT
jgi:hypothetical protein